MSTKPFFKQLILTFMTSFLALHAFGQPLVPTTLTAATGGTALHIQHWETSKGVPVYFVRAPELPMLDVEVMFHAGSAQEGDQFGLAQLTSALLNEGAGNLSADQIGEQFDAVGAIFSSDANRDMAMVGLRSLTEPQFLDPALQTFTTVLTSPTFSPDAFQRIRNQLLVVLDQELQSPVTIGAKALYKGLYPNHPYGHSPNGTSEAIKKLTPSDVKQFYQQYYVTKNAIIALVGNVTTEQASRIAEQVTQSLPEGKAAPAIPIAPEPAQTVQKNIQFPSQQTTVILGQVGITPTDPDYFPLIVGNFILGSDTLSRLFKQVREERGWAYQVSSRFTPLQGRGSFIILLQTRNSEASKALELSKNILQDYIQNGPTPSELAYAQQHMTGEFPLAIASNSNILAQISNIGFYGLPLDYLDTYRQHINAVTVEQIKRAWQQHVDPKKMSIVTVGQP